MKGYWQSRVPEAALIILVTFAVYTPAFHNAFVFDDAIITSHQIIQNRDGLRRIWFTTEAPDYYPLTWSLLWCEWRLWGANPTGYHVVNVALHAINAIVVWRVLQLLKVPAAWLAALVFAVHPINVATVAWVSEQKNTLSMLFAAVAVFCYLRFDEDQRWKFYWLSLAAFLLALLSKNAVLMLSVVLLLCMWWRHGRVRWNDFLHSALFFALSLIFGLVNIWFEHFRAPEDSTVRTVDFLSRLAGAGWPPWFYLYKTILPVNLTVIYPMSNVDPGIWSSYLPVTMLAVCFGLFWWKRKSWGRPVLFGLGYFLVMLFPVLGFIDQGFYRFSLVADHWLYYSIIGAIALVVSGGEKLCRITGEPGRVAGMFASVAVVSTLAMASTMRATVYENDETLWRDNVAKNPNAWAAHYNLGLAVWRASKIEEAIEHYRQALRIKPDDSQAHNNLGLALAAAGKLDAAIVEYRESLRLQPGNAEAHVNLGLALSRLGQPDEALEHFYEAVRLKPGLSMAHFNLASALERRGRGEEAAAQYAEGLRLDPNHAGAHSNLGVILARQGKIDEAIGHFEEAVRQRPDFTEARSNLLAMRQRLQQANQSPKRVAESP